MCLFQRYQLLARILLKYTFFVIALPAAVALNSSVIAINGTTSLNAAHFSRDVALGIATADRAYPNIVPRLYSVNAFATLGRPEPVPFFPAIVSLSFHLRYQKECILYKTGYSKPWQAPVETDQDPQTAQRPAFDWDRLPMSFEEAQLLLYAAKNIPTNQKKVSTVGIFVLTEDHSSGRAQSGDLVFFFVRLDRGGLPLSAVYVNGENGQVFADDINSMAGEAYATVLNAQNRRVFAEDIESTTAGAVATT